MSTTQLRPLGVGEILDVAVKAYGRNARTLIVIGAVVGIPFELLKGVIQLSTVSAPDQVTGSFTGADAMSSDYSRARIAGLAVTLLIGAVVGLLQTAATLRAVSDAYLGETPRVRGSLVFAVRRIWSLIWLYLLLGVGLTFAALALLIPAIWLYVAWSVATPVLLLEGVGGAAALRRSFRLVRGRWWPAAAVLLVGSLSVSIVTFVLVGLLSAIPMIIDGSSVLLAVTASTIASAVAGAVVRPFQAAVTTILYFDLRVRRDGLDLSLLAAGLGLPEAAPTPGWSLDGGLAPIRPADPAGDGEAPPFWPPPPGWRPSGRAPDAAQPPPSPPPIWPPPPADRPEG